jgi:hypothetical protein
MGWLGSVKSRVGHRGAFLLFLAVLDFLYGYSLITVTRAALGRYTMLIPVQAWGWGWISVGVVLLAGAVVKWDLFAFVTSAMFKFAWMSLWVQLWLVQGYPDGWISVTIWGSFAAVVLVVASWPEPVVPP